jgi:hypothetical protein
VARGQCGGLICWARKDGGSPGLVGNGGGGLMKGIDRKSSDNRSKQ